MPVEVALVGRNRELTAIDEALVEGRAFIVIEGEAGVGKSRLVAESTRRHRALVGAAPPYNQPYTLTPVVDALKASGLPVAVRDLTPLAGALRPLFPEWSAELPPALDADGDHLTTRHRLFRALTEALIATGAAALVIEDAHWADETTLEFLLYLVVQRPLPISLLLTHRPEDHGAPGGSLLARLASRTADGAANLRIALEPFGVDGTRELASTLLDGASVSIELARFLHERTDGLPLAVAETLFLMRDRADIARHEGQWMRRDLHEIHVRGRSATVFSSEWRASTTPAGHCWRLRRCTARRPHRQQ